MEVWDAFNNRVFLFLCACISGILFALVWRKYEHTVELSMVYGHYSAALRNTGYSQWLSKQGKVRKILPEEEVKFVEKRDFVLESDVLFNKVPVLCLVFVNSHSGAEAVKQTWGKHCNVLTFFGRFVDAEIPVMKVPPLSSFEGFCYSFVHVWKKYQQKFQWLLIADDSTYSIIENVRFYVAPLNSSFHYYLGHPVKDFSTFYNMGSAGIILSHGSLLLLYSLYQSASDCIKKKAPSWYFDQGLGRILQGFGVNPLDTRDLYSRGRFNPFSVEKMLVPGAISVFSSYWRTSAFLSDEGMNCCSDYAVTFHDISPPKMYLLEFLLYHLAVFQKSPKGLGNKPVLPERLPKIVSSSFKKPAYGDAFVQLVDRNEVGKKTSKLSSKEKTNNGIFGSLWNEVFGN